MERANLVLENDGCVYQDIDCNGILTMYMYEKT